MKTKKDNIKKADSPVTDSEINKLSPKVGKEEIAKAATVLQKYKDGKNNLDDRIIQNDLWYRMRHEDSLNNGEGYSSAWLFNSLANKHADAMDNYPEAIVLPREESDKETAETLSKILPVIFERNGFEKVYNDAWWDKLKSGTAVYGVFWEPSLINGLGDVDIKQIDLLNLFWEPGIKNIQDSENVFYTKLINNSVLKSLYPQLENKLGKSTFKVSEYIHDDSIDTTEKTLVIDWYYKRKVGDKTVLQYCKFCNEEVLYASENDDTYKSRGFYDHGKYPFVFDVLFVENGTPVGFGYVDVMKNAQREIDKLSASIDKNAAMASNPRYFINSSGAVNEEEFADWTKPFVHINGSNLGADSLRPVDVTPLSSIYVEILNNKISELKETSGNRDFSQGSTTSGVTAASAIAALQEAGGKLSRDMISLGYNSFNELNNLVIEVIRQFYDISRSFRIVGPNGDEKFVEFDNSGIAPQDNGSFGSTDLGVRLPVFDLKVKAAKADSYTRLAQNEMALEFYKAGFFYPQNSDVALATINMMEFEGKQSVIKSIQKNGTLFTKLQQLAQIAIQCAGMVDQTTGNGGMFSQQIAVILGSVAGGKSIGAPASVNISENADNSLETQSRQRSNAAAAPRR